MKHGRTESAGCRGLKPMCCLRRVLRRSRPRKVGEREIELGPSAAMFGSPAEPQQRGGGVVRGHEGAIVLGPWTGDASRL